MENSETLKIFVNEESFGQRNLITITGKIEISNSSKGNYFAKELIYISFTNLYETNSTVTMQLRGIDIFNMMYALEETLEKQHSDFKKFTDSSKSKNINSNARKFIATKYDKEKKKIFLNLNMQENNETFKTISFVVFEPFEIKGVVKSLELFMNEYKTFFYKTQRAYEKFNVEKKKKLERQSN